jgi:catalase
MFSYLDTQLKRLGGPNFHEIEINRPKCPMANLQRDGHMRIAVDKGRVSYEPNSLDPSGPRENPQQGFSSVAADVPGAKVRLRADSFADHYSQARLFWRSMTEPEQRHIANAFAFELGKVETEAIRRRMLGHLSIVDEELLARVESKLGMEDQADPIQPARPPIDMAPSPALSIVRKAEPTLAGRKVGVLVDEGTDEALVERLRAAVEKERGRVEVVAPKIAGVSGAGGKRIAADHALAGGPSLFFDAVVVAVTADAARRLVHQPAAVDWLRDAYGHLKVIGHVPDAVPLLERAAIAPDEGIVPLTGTKDVATFIAAAKGPRIWEREARMEADATRGADPKRRNGKR